jgi:serine protease Do
MKRRLIAVASTLALAGLAATSAPALTWPAWMHRTASTEAHSDSATRAAAPRIEPLPAGSEPNFRAIVQAEGPAVVGVTVAGMQSADAGDAASIDDDPFLRFFRGLPGLSLPPQGPSPFRGQGSGFIVSSDGLILTNAHVVRNAKRVTAKLSDRREFSAKVLGSDPVTDVAVLKIEAKDLPAVSLGDSKTLQVGDRVLAIGSPYGFEQTATQGIVSAKGRSLPGDSYVPFIQTDAAVNPGNSGGPLFDAGGRVVGINAQIYSRSGGFQGLAFAIPIDVALHTKDQIVAHGHVDHARLGVTLQDLSAPLAESFGLHAPDGALVSSVVPGSAAQRAGLKAGDVITALDGAMVHTAGDVSSRVGLAQPGDRVTLVVWRDKARHDIPVSLGRADGEKVVAVAHGEGGTLGLSVRPLDRAEMRQAGVDHGLLIERVDGPAQLAGVEAGDVLLALNGRPVHGVDQVREVLQDHPKRVALLIEHNGQQVFVPVDLG